MTCLHNNAGSDYLVNYRLRATHAASIPRQTAASNLEGVGPRIDSITDTLELQVTFNYDSNDNLVAIEAPGLTGQANRQVMRFYYTNLSLTTSGLFGSGVTVTKLSSARVITNIYLPNSVESGSPHTGYSFDYSPYGMIYRTNKFAG